MAGPTKYQGSGWSISGGPTGSVRSITFPEGSRGSVETTHMTTTNGWRTFEPQQLQDPGEVEIEVIYDNEDWTVDLEADAATLTLTAPLLSGQATPASFACSAFVINVSGPEAAFDAEDVLTQTWTFKLTAEPTFTAGA